MEPPQDYSVLGCLREQIEELGPACKEEVFKRQVEAANDWRTDKELKAACEVLLPSLPSLRRSLLCVLPVSLCPVRMPARFCVCSRCPLHKRGVKSHDLRNEGVQSGARMAENCRRRYEGTC
jgi:hypothetical protein